MEEGKLAEELTMADGSMVRTQGRVLVNFVVLAIEAQCMHG